MSFVSTYNNMSIRGWSTNQSEFYPITTLQIANSSGFGFIVECDNDNYAFVSSPSMPTYAYTKNVSNIFISIGNVTGAAYIISTSNDANYTILSNLGISATILQRSGNTFSNVTISNPYPISPGNNFGLGVSMASLGTFSSATSPRQGNVYFYERTGNTWNHHSTINSNTTIKVGQTVSINEDGTKIVCGFKESTLPGKVYYFTRSNTIYTLNQTLSSDDPYSSDQFGGKVLKIVPSGNYLLIGDDGARINGNVGVGAAYLYIYNTDSGMYDQLYKFIPEDTSANSFYGATGDISDDGNIITIGDNWTNGTRQGKFYVYQKNIANTYTLTNIYSGPDGNNSGFSQGLTISGNGNTILSGAYLANSGAGKVYQFNK